jgi:hypothetical protein
MNRESGSALQKAGPHDEGPIFLETLEPGTPHCFDGDGADQAAAVPIKAMRRNARMALISTRQKLREAIALTSEPFSHTVLHR